MIQSVGVVFPQYCRKVSFFIMSTFLPRCRLKNGRKHNLYLVKLASNTSWLNARLAENIASSKTKFVDVKETITPRLAAGQISCLRLSVSCGPVI